MKLLVVSLGCDKNLTNTEEMMGLLSEAGHSFTDDESEAEAIIINTCAFIGDAKEESINTILSMADYKDTNGGICKALIVCGCLSQRYARDILKEIKEVDAVIGTSAYDEIARVLEDVLNGMRHGIYIKDTGYLPDIRADRLITTGGHFAYLKIAEGCDRHCTYCIIPKLRGPYRSVPIERLIFEAKRLAKSGVKELILVAQDTTLYGVDLYKEKSLHKLLHELARIDGIEWIRILYAYPEEIYDELVYAIRDIKKVCNYIDMPVQSGDDKILKAMGRHTTVESIKGVIDNLRKNIPDICIRTTLISGFPSESIREHKNTLEFVKTMAFDRLGVFTYSREEDTVADSFPNQVRQGTKDKRRDEIMRLQQELVFDKNKSLTGCIFDAFIEGKITEDDVYVARTYRDAPGVDGYIFINSDRTFISGDFVKVRVTMSNDYDLIGEICDESTQ